MKNRKRFCLALALLLALSLLTACGASGANTAADTAAVTDSYKNSVSTAPSAAAGDNGGLSYWTADAEESWEEPAEYGSAEDNGSASLPANTKLIYTASIDLETTEFDTAAAALETLVAGMDGYFESSSLDNYSAYRCAYYTVRVPAENFESFCTRAGELCQLNSISRSAQDVSEAYYDTESRLLTQQTKLERLQDLLSRAESMEDIITLESAISETELAIENLTGALRKYDSLVGYSTVHISLNEVYALSEVEEPVIGFGARLAQAFRSGCTSFSRGVQDLLLSLARNWTGWLIFLVLAAAAVILVRRAVKRRTRARKEALRGREENKKPDGGGKE